MQLIMLLIDSFVVLVAVLEIDLEKGEGPLVGTVKFHLMVLLNMKILCMFSLFVI